MDNRFNAGGRPLQRRPIADVAVNRFNRNPRPRGLAREDDRLVAPSGLWTVRS